MAAPPSSAPARRTRPPCTALGIGLLVACVACDGVIGSISGPGYGEAIDPSDLPGRDRPNGDPDDPGGGGAGDGCEPRLAQRVVLLNDYQHASALRALLGDDVIDADSAPQRELKPFAQKGLVVSTSLVHTRGAWAERAADKVRANPAEVTGCATIDAACAERFLRELLPRAFRRKVDDEEIRDLMAVYTLAGETDPANGVARAVEAALSSPSFMYRRELGAAERDGEVSLDPYELASELSFALTDGPPDDALWEAAEKGTLTSADELKRQVERLLALPEVQDSLTSTLLSAWGLGNLFGSVKDPTLFPEFTPGLARSMYRETELLVKDVLWERRADVSELLTTRTSFVNASLAALYGVENAPESDDEFREVTLPVERSGLLTLPSVLAMLARSDTTSVVARGLFVRGLLCMPKVGAPPDSLSGAISELLEEDLSERERAEVRADTPQCAGCHAGIDPFGLLLESFDPLGRHRTTLDGEPIDTSVHVPDGYPHAGRHDDVVSFLDGVAAGDELAACITTRLLAYATQDDALAPNTCQVTGALGNDEHPRTMSELVTRAFTSPALRMRKKESP